MRRLARWLEVESKIKSDAGGANELYSILFTAGRGRVFDLRDTLAGRGLRRQAGCCGEEEEEAKEGCG